MGPPKIAPANVSPSPPPNKTPDETSIDDDAEDRWEHSTEVNNEAQLGVDNVSPPNSGKCWDTRNDSFGAGVPLGHPIMSVIRQHTTTADDDFIRF